MYPLLELTAVVETQKHNNNIGGKSYDQKAYISLTPAKMPASWSLSYYFLLSDCSLFPGHRNVCYVSITIDTQDPEKAVSVMSIC